MTDRDEFDDMADDLVSTMTERRYTRGLDHVLCEYFAKEWVSPHQTAAVLRCLSEMLAQALRERA